MSLTVHPVYQTFGTQSSQIEDWEPFKTKNSDEEAWKSNQADLKITKNSKTCWRSGGKFALMSVKICILPWGICSGVRFCINKFALRQVYPAQRRFTKRELDTARMAILQEQNQNGKIVRHLRLQKDSRHYNGLLVSSADTIKNGRWALHAGGNKASIETECNKKPKSYADIYLQEGFNVLLVNGPGVGFSSPMDSIKQLGEAQELGLSFLESAIKAQVIVITGISIGGGALSLMINQHTFLPRKYLVLRFASFGRLSDAIKVASGKFGQFVLARLKCEIDSVSASERLQRLQIPEVIYQNENDEQMKNEAINAELAFALRQKGLIELKTFKTITGAKHYQLVHDQISEELRLWQKSLAQSHHQLETLKAV